MSFEFFNGTQASKSTTPKITVRRGGVLVLNESAVRMLGDDVTFVRIAYDDVKDAVGLVKATEDGAGCYRLRPQKDGYTWIVNCKPMFEHHGVTVPKAQTYDVETFDNGIIGATLNGIPLPQEEPKDSAPEPQVNEPKGNTKNKKA